MYNSITCMWQHVCIIMHGFKWYIVCTCTAFMSLNDMLYIHAGLPVLSLTQSTPHTVIPFHYMQCEEVCAIIISVYFYTSDPFRFEKGSPKVYIVPLIQSCTSSMCVFQRLSKLSRPQESAGIAKHHFSGQVWMVIPEHAANYTYLCVVNYAHANNQNHNYYAKKYAHVILSNMYKKSTNLQATVFHNK